MKDFHVKCQVSGKLIALSVFRSDLLLSDLGVKLNFYYYYY